MPLLTKEEAFEVTDAFLLSLYGEDLYVKWQELKEMTKFVREREFLNWLIEVGYQYVTDESSVVRFPEGSADGSMAIKDDDSSTYESYLHQQQHQQQHSTPMTTASSDEVQPMDNGTDVSSYFMPSSGGDGMLVAGTDHINITPGEDRGLSSGMDVSPRKKGKLGMFPGEDPIQPHQPGGVMVEKAYTCLHCSYSTDSKQHLDRHVQGVHERAKPFACPHCSHRSSQKIHLKQHLISRHGYESSYMCPKCGKSFNAPYSLERHQAKCQGAQPAPADGEAVPATQLPLVTQIGDNGEPPTVNNLQELQQQQQLLVDTGGTQFTGQPT